MYQIATVIILLAVVTALAQITDLIRVPYPILLVLAGMGLGFITWIPPVTLHPDVIFLIFLPPILFDAAWSTSWPDFKAAKRPITLLAIGCVLFTTCAVAVMAHQFIPALGWAEAFVLGAIISPPDAIAAAAATKGLSIPKRVVTILEGESLVNDATGLIAYRYAVAAVVTGTFSLFEASYQFIFVAGGGILLGLVLGMLFKELFRLTPDNPTTDTSFTFITPYVAYLFAESIHVSGVLSVVTAGLYISRHSSEIFSQQTRLQALGAWRTVIFILNGIIFIIIGLQLPSIYHAVVREHSLPNLLRYAAIVSGTVIVGRIIWVIPGTYLPRWFSSEIRQTEPRPKKRLVTIVAWSGMRGVVSLAAAMALPLVLEGSRPFPHRNLIIFLTFCVIFSTLVLQGLTLRPLIRLLRVQADGTEHQHEQEARLRIASAIIEHIEETYSLSLTEEVLNQVKTKYEIRIQRLRKDKAEKFDEATINQFQKIQQELIDVERKLVIGLRKEGKVSDEVLRKIEYELDLEETRLILERTS